MSWAGKSRWMAVSTILLFVSCTAVDDSEVGSGQRSDRGEPREKQQLNELELEPVSFDGPTLFRFKTPAETGINFENIIVETNEHNILTYSYMYNGGGVAAGDINNDGLVDLFFTSNQDQNRLYLNRGGLEFEDISEAAGIAESRGWHSGICMADVNADGWLDIYICRSGPDSDKSSRANLLYINDGELAFQESAQSYGVADTNHSTQASFFDHDKDGDLDLYVLNHPIFFDKSKREVLQLIQQPEVLKATTDHFYRNNGDGTFTQATAETGIVNHGYGLGVVTADLNDDGWTDIYIANDFSTPDFMYINNQDGTFSDQIKERTRHISYYGMGCDVVDINRDTNPDIIELDMTARDRIRSKTLMPSMAPNVFWGLINDLKHQYQYMFNTLQLNQGDGYFSEIGLMAGVAKTDWSWAVLGGDFDNDGWEDLLVTNGFRRDSKDNDFLNRYRQGKRASGGMQGLVKNGKMMEWVEQIPSQRLRNYLFRNIGDLTFADNSTPWGFHEGSFSSGAVYADLDSDGDLDLVINNIDDPAFIYENLADQQQSENHFLRVSPLDANGSPALNAKVKVVAAGQAFEKELTVVRGFQSSVEPVLHFGLGELQQIDLVEVTWSDGSTDRIDSAEADETLVIQQQSGSEVSLASTEPDQPPASWMAPSDSKAAMWHSEFDHDEYEKEVLLPHSQSTLGPALAVADVNGDGRQDIFFGGAHGQVANLQLQDSNGRFQPAPGNPLGRFSNSENVNALFFDADGDDDLDLYVVNGGGSEFEPGDPMLADQFFRNNDGNLEYDKSAIPAIASSNSVAVSIDYDGDKDLDLFIGARLIPGEYPFAPDSYLLENNDGNFTPARIEGLGELGLINDAVATDFDSDGLEDLIAIGEWTEPIFLKNTGTGFEQQQIPGTENLRGWWFSITEADVNSDGRQDYLLGNLGKNNKFKHDLKVYCDDFDDNGTNDIVLATHSEGHEYPVRGKECSTQQMPFIESKFPTYREFALADLNEIIGSSKLDGSLTLQVDGFASCVLINRGDSFEKIDLPNQAQISPIRDALATDVNGDGHVDFVAVGNLYGTEVETPRYDAGMGIVLVGDGSGKFAGTLSGESGLRVMEDSRRIELIETPTGTKIAVASNNSQLLLFDTSFSDSD